jgi:hypothetical protein
MLTLCGTRQELADLAERLGARLEHNSEGLRLVLDPRTPGQLVIEALAVELVHDLPPDPPRIVGPPSD